MCIGNKILCTIAYYQPGYKAGGPIKTIKNMVEHFCGDLEFLITTRDRDLGDPVPFGSVDLNIWIIMGSSKVIYLSPDKLTVRAIAKVINNVDFDVLYLNSFFDMNFTIKPLLARRLGLIKSCPTILAPRGEFSNGALGIRSFKKQVFIFLSRLLGLHRNVIWHASSEFEKRDIVSAYKVSPDDVFVARDIGISASAHDDADLTANNDILRIVFLSRISPMKNLVYALRVLKKVSEPLVFDIYGPVEDSVYWGECERIIDELPRHIKVNYYGSLQPDDVSSVLRRYELFFLPTQGENYGHVIAEALASGLPVLISDRTPWRGLEARLLGWDLPLDNMDSFVCCIDNFAQISPEERLEARRRVLVHSSDLLDVKKDIDDTREMFHLAINRRFC